ncbi:MAG: hypothetical protein M1821_004294 [Bathelium mastoideum]|nr:MAG: hypothetical protein M1821_004294 [Bathelium mastoideum]KAI9684041.1 MAG: hypothetical protein M1822_005868 [Bathelium mastoideum]
MPTNAEKPASLHYPLAPARTPSTAPSAEPNGTAAVATSSAGGDAAESQKAILSKVGDRVTSLIQTLKREHPNIALRGELKLDFGTGPDGAFNISMDGASSAVVGIYKRHIGPTNGMHHAHAATLSREPVASTQQLGKHPREPETPASSATSPEKRARTISEPVRPESPPPTLPEDFMADEAPAALQDLLQWHRRRSQDHHAVSANKLERLIVDWREQWREQGGWMYDFFKRAHDDEVAKKAWMEHMFKEVESRVGAVMQSYHVTASSDLAVKHSQTLVEFQRLKEDIRWLEDRRTNADTQHDRREETWRSSSATFHDTAHKNREIAEKWMVSEVKIQRDNMRRMTDMLLDVCKELKGADYKMPPAQSLSPVTTRPAPLEAQLREAAERTKAPQTVDLTRSAEKSRASSEAQTSSGHSEAQTASEGT